MKKAILSFLLLCSLNLLAAQGNNCLSLYLETATGSPGDTICLDIRAKGFDDILGLQFSMGWDPAQLSFHEIGGYGLPGLGANSFNVSPAAVEAGYLALSWFDLALEGVSMPDNSVLFTACFIVEGNLPAAVLFRNEPTAIELVHDTQVPLTSYTLAHGGVTNSTPPLEIASSCIQINGCDAVNGATVAVAGGQPPYNFRWSDEAGVVLSTATELTGAFPGRYSLEVEDAAGAIATALLSVIPDDGIYSLNASLTPASCAAASDGAVELSPQTYANGAAFDAVWSDGGAGLSRTGLAAGNYGVTVTNTTNGCFTTRSYELAAGDGPMIDGTARDADCNADNGEVTASITNGGTGLTYNWSNGATTLNPGLLAPGTYTLTVTNTAGCASSKSFTVERSNRFAFSYQLSPPTCGNTDGAIAVEVPDNGAYTFLWSDGNTNQNRTGLAAGNYQLTITGPNGACSTTESFAVPVSDMDYTYSYDCADAGGGNFSAALTSTVQAGGTGPYTFTWNTGQIDTSQSSSTLSGLPGNGSYVVTITDADGCVQVADTFQLNCSLASEYLTAYTFECRVFPPDSTAGDLTFVVWQGPAPPYTFEWSNGVIDVDSLFSTNAGLADGWYTLTITDANGQVHIPNPVLLECGSSDDVLLADYDLNCSGGNSPQLTAYVSQGGAPPYEFAWSTGLTETHPNESVITADNGNTYSVTVTDANGQQYSPGPFLTDCPPPDTNLIVGITYDCLVFSDSTVATVSALVWGGGVPPYRFEWSNSVVDTSDQLSQVAGPGGLNYSVTITDANGKTATAAVFADCGPPEAPTALSIAEAQGLSGDTLCLPVTAGMLENLASLELGVSWNTLYLDFLGIQALGLPGLSISDFGLNAIALGELSLAWQSSGPDGVDVADGTVLFELCFRLSGDAGTGSLVTFASDVAPLLAADTAQQSIPLIGADGAILILSDNTADVTALRMDSTVVEPGQSFCMDVTVENFTDILGLQGTMRWNPDSLQFDSLAYGSLPGLSANNFNFSDVSEGYFRFSWVEPGLNPVTLTDGTVIFSLCFTAAGQEGSSAVSFSSVPTLIELTDPSGAIPVQLFQGQVDILDPDLWPGDTDTDEDVDHYDLLNIGLAYGASGPPRPVPGIAWDEMQAYDWENATPVSQVNFKHMDTDGNGTIEAADTLAIVQNWGLMPNIVNPGPRAGRSMNAPLYIKPDTILLGETVGFDIIFGEEGAPAQDVYGIAFTIVMDTAAVVAGSAAVHFDGSWMGQIGSNLLALGREHPENGTFDLALTRTDGNNISGQGSIGKLHITIQDVIFMRQLYYEMRFEIRDVRLINRQEEEIVVLPQSSVALVETPATATQSAEPAGAVRVFPVPAKGQVFIDAGGKPVERVEIFGPDGRQLSVYQGRSAVPVHHLPEGPYFLRIWAANTYSLHRIVVIR